MQRLSLPLLVLVYCCSITISANHVYSDSFPTNDEYDFNILDPHHIHGSPYGGFGRATRSRLAALPLHLPGTVGEYTGEEEVSFMEMRDGDGRLFACRVYHEDELTGNSLAESMFNTARLAPLLNKDGEVVSNTVKETIVEETTKEAVTAGSEEVNSELSRVLQATQVLDKLDGVCTQIHRGWWSYEWCHGNKVTQFHVRVESGQGQVESITSLGAYSTSTVYTDGDPDEQDDKTRAALAALNKEEEDDAEEDETKELAVVLHDFENGDVCPETKKPRRTQVKLKCCPLKRMNRLKRAVLFHGDPVASNIAAITKMKETSVCNYSLEVCTPLLCEGVAEAFEDGLVAKEVKKDTGKLMPASLAFHERKGTESIREILQGTLKNVCLRFFNGGWYVRWVQNVVGTETESFISDVFTLFIHFLTT